MEQFDFELRLDVDPVVMFGMPAIDLGLAVLAHHDDRRCIGRLEGKHQVEQDKRDRGPNDR